MAGCVGLVGLSLFAVIEEHNYGVFGSTLAKNGVEIRPARLEAPEQIGRVERRGAMLKKMVSKAIKDTRASGRASMDMTLSECLNAANEMTRHSGFAPAQWVLSRPTRNPAVMGDEDECLDVGALQAHADGPTTFGVQSRYRAKAREAFVPLCERPHLFLDPTKLEILSRIAEKREQVNMDCNGASVRD